MVESSRCFTSGFPLAAGCCGTCGTTAGHCRRLRRFFEQLLFWGSQKGLEPTIWHIDRLYSYYIYIYTHHRAAWKSFLCVWWMVSKCLKAVVSCFRPQHGMTILADFLTVSDSRLFTNGSFSNAPYIPLKGARFLSGKWWERIGYTIIFPLSILFQ